MPTALIIGGTGQIGIAIAHLLTRSGWHVRLAARNPVADLPGDFVHLDKTEDAALARALGDGADLLVDCVAFNADDARALLSAQDRVTQILAISSVSVFCDAKGRVLDTAAADGFPEMPIPIPEDHPTVAPGDTHYSDRKAAMEAVLCEGARIPASILRPAAIHGPHSKHAREYWFLRRIRDNRAAIPLANQGASRFQTTAAQAIALATLWAYERGDGPVASVTDADAPSVLEIGQTIARWVGAMPDFVGHANTEPGRTPWSAPNPLIYASSAPNAGTYAETVTPALEWLDHAVTAENWRERIPQLAAYPRDHFDYAAEDRWLAARAT
ncbi:MAG: NAD-dependent epimerase/dehydratase family protein [Pseudomonadota bacterium]